MPAVTNTVYDINYSIGWVIVTNAVIKATGKEVKRSSMQDFIRKRMIADGRWGPTTHLSDETDRLEDWERRRTRTQFNRPFGMFIFRITDDDPESDLGRMEMRQWPVR